MEPFKELDDTESNEYRFYIHMGINMESFRPWVKITLIRRYKGVGF